MSTRNRTANNTFIVVVFPPIKFPPSKPKNDLAAAGHRPHLPTAADETLFIEIAYWTTALVPVTVKIPFVTAPVSLRFHFFRRNVLNAVAAINTCASAGSTGTSFIPSLEFGCSGVFVRK
jgi:hypothetical protein